MASGLHLLLWLSISWSFLVHHPQAAPDFSLPEFHSTAFPSSLWLNTLPASTPERTYTDGSLIRPILVQSQAFNYSLLRSDLCFACCFICRDDCNGFLFSIVIVEIASLASNAQRTKLNPVQVVWSANRNKPVKEGANLELTKDGDLVLTDVDGSISWSSGTAGKSIARMELCINGSLGLFDSRGDVIWESFEHPSDTLLQGQRLAGDQRLTASVSSSNFTEGLPYMIFNSAMLAAYIQSHPPMRYYSRGFIHVFSVVAHCNQTCYLGLINSSLELHFSPSTITRIPLPQTHSVQFLRLDSDGHFRLYQFDGFQSWKVVADLFSDSLDDCDYPTACGSYGICTKGQCSCPNGVDNYFTSLNADPKLGCPAVTELSCEQSQLHRFMTLYGVSYFSLTRRVLSGVDDESCKVSCLSNCSCRAAFLQYTSNASSGTCYLLFHEVFSLVGSPKSELYNYTTFLKVQRPNHLNGSEYEYVERNKSRVSSKNKVKLLVVVVLGSVAVAISISLIIIVYKRALFFRKKPPMNGNVDRMDSEENHFEHVLKLPAPFLYKDIVSATNNFSVEIGSGGSGSVFEGTLVDGKKVAVKRIERILQGKKQFLAEIETIGSTHHVNLVRLIGFCIERSYYLLVFEYMQNGSLEKWIYNEDQNFTLNWQSRYSIILDVAKGLAYLHEECQQRILHLDIKPQNILLDENFKAKIADFGLSKVVNKEHSKVVTTMRGTLGYMAPEWLNSIITEKVDVYSFGILVLEIVCGRKNVDFRQPIEDIYLLKLLKEKAIKKRLQDLIVKYNDDRELCLAEGLKMLTISMWCLQSDFNSRPDMSKVVKVLEDAVDVEPAIDYNFLIPSTMSLMDKFSNPIFNTILSGPR